MNGPHDMGGMQCYGPVAPEEDEPVFHEDWEKRALALTVAMGFTGMWNLDQSRYARESLPPTQYLSSTYYQIWLAALENLLLERAMIGVDELQDGTSSLPPVATAKPVPDCETMRAALAEGGAVARKADKPARFSIGDRVKTRNLNPESHTRLPRYARAKRGIVHVVHGVYVYPDSNASGAGEDPQWLYAVAFDAEELFGTGTHAVLVDCFEPYLAAG